MTVRIGSYTALERPDGGHRATGSALWRGEDEAGTPACLLILPVADADEVRLRVAGAAAISHRHLLPVIDVVEDDERIAVVSPWPRGGRLLELIRRRGTLNAGQTLTVLIPLASTVAAVHRAGGRHGGVGAGSVFFDEHGRPQLCALAISTIVSDWNGGLPGQSWDVAPEVVRGEHLHHGPITPAADVFSLGSLALYCLTGRSAWPADDPTDVLIQSTAGVWPEPPEGCGPPELLQVMRRMLLNDPAERPAAADLVGLLAAIGSPSPVPLGGASVPATSSPARWRGWSGAPGTDRVVPSAASNLTGDVPDPPAGTRRLTGSGDGDTTGNDRDITPAPASAGPPRTVDQPPAATGRDMRRFRRARPVRPRLPGRASTSPRILTDRAARPAMSGARPAMSGARPEMSGARPAGPTPIARAGIAALTVVLIMAVGLQIWVWSTGSEGSGASAASDASVTGGPPDTPLAPDPATTRDPAPSAPTTTPTGPIPVSGQDWRAVVTALDEARSRALSAADPALLDQVYVPGSAAAQADTATIRSLRERGWRVSGGRHHIEDVTVLATGGPPGAATPTQDVRGPSASSSTTARSAGTGDEPTLVRVVVRASLPAYPVLDANGRQVAVTATRPREEQILSIGRTDAGYRISAVQAG